MKIIGLVSVFSIFIIISSCNQQPVAVKDQMNTHTTANYLAVDAGDTAWLQIDTSHRRMLGLLKFRYANNKIYEGHVKGVLSGDTLKGHFDFKVNKVDKWYRNPVSFLKRDQSLIMGVGNFTLIWGSGYFDGTPIDYSKGRFVFHHKP